MILKKIYFPDNVYSDNKEQFKKLLSSYGLVWNKNLMRSYTYTMVGVYSNNNNSKGIMAIYEGSGKPVTMIVKVLGPGGKFLLDILGFSATIGCEIYDIDEEYVDKAKNALKTYGSLDILYRKKYSELEGLKKIQMKERIDNVVNREVDKYIDSAGLILESIGYNLDVVKYFKKRDFEINVINMLDNGLDSLISS